MIRPSYLGGLAVLGLAAVAWISEAILGTGTLAWLTLACAVTLSAVDIACALRLKPQGFERELPAHLAVGRPHLMWISVSNPYPVTLRASYSEYTSGTYSAVGHTAGLPRRLAIPPRHKARLAYELRPKTRGTFALGQGQWYISGPLGLWQARHRLALPQRSRVGPDLAAAQRRAMPLRPVPPGAPTPLWPGAAHAQGQRPALVLWIDSGPALGSTRDGERLLDAAIDAALALACAALGRGLRVALQVGSGESQAYLAAAAGDQQLYEVYQRLEALQPSASPMDWAASAAALLEHTTGPARVVLMTRLSMASSQLLATVEAVAGAHPLVVADVVEQGLLDDTRRRVGNETSARAYCLAVRSLGARQRLGEGLEAAGATLIRAPAAQLTDALLRHCTGGYC